LQSLRNTPAEIRPHALKRFRDAEQCNAASRRSMSHKRAVTRRRSWATIKRTKLKAKNIALAIARPRRPSNWRNGCGRHASVLASTGATGIPNWQQPAVARLEAGGSARVWQPSGATPLHLASSSWSSCARAVPPRDERPLVFRDGDHVSVRILPNKGRPRVQAEAAWQAIVEVWSGGGERPRSR
jgi:hypothetical protein